jgi:uncharacterized protein (TIGR03086 family)
VIGLTPQESHRRVAEAFSQRVRGAAPDAWDDPAPVDGWRARDVVDHLVTWFPAFLEGGTGIVLPTGDAGSDPLGAWEAQAAAVQRILDDPASAGKVLTNPHLGEVPLPQAIEQFYTADVFMHTWDLARATGQDETLDEDIARELYEGMLPMDEILRQSGQYGAAVPVPDDADWQTKLLGFIGRKV